MLADVAAEPFTGPEDAVRRGDDTTLALLLAPAAGAFRERGAGGS